MTRTTRESLAATPSDLATSPTLLELLPRFRRHLAAANKAPRTIESYAEAVEQLHRFLTVSGMPVRVAGINGEHLEAFMVNQLERLRPSSARIRYASLQQFWKWVEADGEITASPMKVVPRPQVPEQPVPVLSDDELKALVHVAESDADFLSRRDAAIIRLFADTGARLSEVAELNVADVDLDGGTVSVLGKGRRVRNLPVGSRTVRALDRYLAVRGRHPDHEHVRLWLGTQGPLTAYGISEMVKRRARQAGIGEVHVHQLRHTAAHFLRLNGMDDDSVMRIMGWRDRSMLHRYGASAADERAREAHRRLSPGDRL
jgi:site-specific recombinase XerD